ncbi:hypothetical protein LEN26_002099 [Aphanomyces euteiches]|nr:hypothetical protein LEN26_002099 [Aphanomyces euteiches]
MSKVYTEEVSKAAPVAAARGARRVVKYSRGSLLFNGLFTLKLVCTPFFAYMTEPWPWHVLNSAEVPVFDSFDAFRNASFAYFYGVFNNQTLEPSTVVCRESTSNSHLVRKTVALPEHVRPDDCMDFVCRWPGAVFYSSGFRRSSCDFLAQSNTNRTSKLWFDCEHAQFFGTPMSEVCIWIEPTRENNQGNRLFTVYHVSLIWEKAAWSWAKLALRGVLSSYIIRVLWRRYYRHYPPLLVNLAQIGLGAQFTKYIVLIGDPSFLILSDAFVSVAMVVDILFGVAYMTDAILRVSQFSDFFAFVLGCIYISRYVWTGYLVMRFLSWVVKRRGDEAKFAPVDPAILALAAYFYGGPVLSLIANTPLMQVSYALLEIHFVSNDGIPPGHVVEALPDTLFMCFLLGTLPVLVSATVGRYRRFKQRRRQIANSDRSTATTGSCRYCPRANNDFTNKCVMRFVMRRIPISTKLLGGSLYHLYDNLPEHRSLPLFSHRGSDCLILCYTADGAVSQQVRVSLRDYLDLRHRDPTKAIASCSSVHETCVSSLNAQTCETFRAVGSCPSARLCLHSSADDSPWILCDQF